MSTHVTLVCWAHEGGNALLKFSNSGNLSGTGFLNRNASKLWRYMACLWGLSYDFIARLKGIHAT